MHFVRFFLKFGMVLGQVMRFSKTTGYKLGLLMVAGIGEIQNFRQTVSIGQ